MPKIKICGLKRLEDIYSVNEYIPDYIGFVFAGKKRLVSPELAYELKRHLDKSIKAVGVFVDAEIDFIIKLITSRTIDIIQLHGNENNTYISKLRERTSVPIIKAIRVKSAEDILKGETIQCDYLLLDTYVEDSYGGSGKSFDWSIIPKISKPFFLAGGLTPENIAVATNVEPYCLDISSGVETDGFKDKAKIAQVIKTVRSV